MEWNAMGQRHPELLVKGVALPTRTCYLAHHRTQPRPPLYRVCVRLPPLYSGVKAAVCRFCVSLCASDERVKAAVLPDGLKRTSLYRVSSSALHPSTETYRGQRSRSKPGMDSDSHIRTTRTDLRTVPDLEASGEPFVPFDAARSFPRYSPQPLDQRSTVLLILLSPQRTPRSRCCGQRWQTRSCQRWPLSSPALAVNAS